MHLFFDKRSSATVFPFACYWRWGFFFFCETAPHPSPKRRTVLKAEPSKKKNVHRATGSQTDEQRLSEKKQNKMEKKPRCIFFLYGRGRGGGGEAFFLSVSFARRRSSPVFLFSVAVFRSSPLPPHTPPPPSPFRLPFIIVTYFVLCFSFCRVRCQGNERVDKQTHTGKKSEKKTRRHDRRGDARVERPGGRFHQLPQSTRHPPSSSGRTRCKGWHRGGCRVSWYTRVGTVPAVLPSWRLVRYALRRRCRRRRRRRPRRGPPGPRMRVRTRRRRHCRGCCGCGCGCSRCERCYCRRRCWRWYCCRCRYRCRCCRRGRTEALD